MSAMYYRSARAAILCYGETFPIYNFCAAYSDSCPKCLLAYVGTSQVYFVALTRTGQTV